MNRVLSHALLPAFAPTAIVALYFTPVEVFGCVGRGLMAVGVAMLSAVAAVVTVGIGIGKRARGDDSASWWLLSTCILTLPLVLLLGPLG